MMESGVRKPLRTAEGEENLLGIMQRPEDVPEKEPELVPLSHFLEKSLGWSWVLPLHCYRSRSRRLTISRSV